MRSRAYPIRRAIEAFKAAQPATCRLCGEMKRADHMADWLTIKRARTLTDTEIDRRADVCKECFTR